ncbi:MAG: DUF499 domain-containing protein [bacterium]
MEPWYKVATPRAEVREGRSFNPDEFAIALEQVVAGTAPLDYRDAEKFFSRTYFTRALREHAGMVERRLSGKTENTSPVLTLVTQFGGGKTHTLTALYHIAKNGEIAFRNTDVKALLSDAGVTEPPKAKVAVFVGNAWDPKPGRETPWTDIAFQIAGKEGVEALGLKALTSPPGTDTLTQLFKIGGGNVLILFDEVLNFMNRHRDMAESFHSFIQNLTVAMTGVTNCATVISLPRSQVEMTSKDLEWQEKITKVVRRVAKDLIANDESEISEVVRRRLFEDIGKESIRKAVAKEYSDWCFERRAELPFEWTTVDTANTETKAKEFLRNRFESCYPFHPSTLSVFQRKWQTLPQYQQTRGTLAMLAQWISWVYKDNFTKARKEALITIGSAPLHVPDFQATVIGQLGEGRLVPAIDSDIVGQFSHAKALDADTKGPLKDIHQRLATAIFFESSGGMREKVAHLPELRFALGEPNIDTTSIDTGASTLESRSFFLRKFGTDGYQFGFKPTLKKVVNDRKASLGDDEVKKVLRSLIKKEFEKGALVPLQLFPEESSAVPDSPRLTLAVMDPDIEWNDASVSSVQGESGIRKQLQDWCRNKGNSPRIYPGSIVWCLRKPGRALCEKVEMWLAWNRVQEEIATGTLGGEFDPDEKKKVIINSKDAEEQARDEVWASYRFAYLLDPQSRDGMKAIDLSAGHGSRLETLTGRIITALRSEGLLNESVGVGYLERNWPTALKESGIWPLLGLRQSFLNGSLTRLIDPDKMLTIRIPEFVEKGDFGLASGSNPDGTYQNVWYKEPLSHEEVAFDKDVFLLKKEKAEKLKSGNVPPSSSIVETPITPIGGEQESLEPTSISTIITPAAIVQLQVSGSIPPELWNRFGSKILPKVRDAENLSIHISITMDGQTDKLSALTNELRQSLADIGLKDEIEITFNPF